MLYIQRCITHLEAWSLRSRSSGRVDLVALHPLLEADLDALVDCLQAVQSGANIEHEDGITMLVVGGRVIVDDVADLFAAVGWARDDPVVSVEWWLSVEFRGEDLA